MAGELRRQVERLVGEAPVNGILRLRDVLLEGAGSGGLGRDFRKVMHVAFGTRDAGRIAAMGGHECGFSIWLCGLYVLCAGGGDALGAGSLSEERLRAWLTFLREWYGSPPRALASAGEDSGGADAEESGEKLELVESYLHAVRLSLQKHPLLLYGDPLVTRELLFWCLTVVRAEGVVLPGRNGDAALDENGFVLFLERGD